MKTSLLALITFLWLLILPSCQEDISDQDLIDVGGLKSAALAPDPSVDLYYGPETFSTIYPPITQTCIITNPDFEDFRLLVLKVQNGESKKTQVRVLEIRIDDVLILTAKDFPKGTNIVAKPLSGLKANSVMEVKLFGPLESFINLKIEGKKLIYGQVSDIDGNIYKTMQIGNQWWMAENLKTTRYNDGTPIEHPGPDFNWYNYSSGAYAWYNDDETYKNTYGALYNWWAVYTGKLCPCGWHIPTDGSWKELEIFLGMSQADADAEGFRGDVGGKLKSTRTDPDPHPRWASPNTGATDESGFSALPGGYRPPLPNNFQRMMGMGEWWSLSPLYPLPDLRYYHYRWARRLESNDVVIMREADPPSYGYSVRCIKDVDIFGYDVKNTQKPFGYYYDPSFSKEYGSGQSFVPSQDCRMTAASVKFQDSFGQSVELRMELRDINGNILCSIFKPLDASFSGGWVRVDFDDIIKLIAGQEYILTWHIMVYQTAYPDIRNFSLGDQYSGFAFGRGFIGEKTGYPGPLLDDWTYWQECPMDFCFKIHGE